jgi:hypothetical protein
MLKRGSGKGDLSVGMLLAGGKEGTKNTEHLVNNLRFTVAIREGLCKPLFLCGLIFNLSHVDIVGRGGGQRLGNPSESWEKLFTKHTTDFFRSFVFIGGHLTSFRPGQNHQTGRVYWGSAGSMEKFLTGAPKVWA